MELTLAIKEVYLNFNHSIYLLRNEFYMHHDQKDLYLPVKVE